MLHSIEHTYSHQRRWESLSANRLCPSPQSACEATATHTHNACTRNVHTACMKADKATHSPHSTPRVCCRKRTVETVRGRLPAKQEHARVAQCTESKHVSDVRDTESSVRVQTQLDVGSPQHNTSGSRVRGNMPRPVDVILAYKRNSRGTSVIVDPPETNAVAAILTIRLGQRDCRVVTAGARSTNERGCITTTCNPTRGSAPSHLGLIENQMP